MGVQLFLEIASESEEEGIILSRRFLEQIIRDWGLLFEHAAFLTKDEIEALRPNECGEVRIGSTSSLAADKKEEYLQILRNMMRGEAGMGAEREFLLREGVLSEQLADRARNPEMLLNIIRKIEAYMKENEGKLPLVHLLYTSKEDLLSEDDAGYIPVEGVQCAVEGDLYHEDNYVDRRNKIKIKSYGEEGGKVDFYVEVKPIVAIGGIHYLTKTITKTQQYREDFKRIITFLEQAVAKREKVLWEYC
jgi:hypothetical protein